LGIGLVVNFSVLRLLKKSGMDILRSKAQIIAFFAGITFPIIPLIFEPYGVYPGFQKVAFVSIILFLGLLKILAERQLMKKIHSDETGKDSNET